MSHVPEAGVRRSTVKVADQWLRQILDLLYRNRDLTRAEITAGTGLNAASVSHALRRLLDRRVILKVGELESNGGRRREVFNLNAEAGYFVAVDLEGESIRFALTNLLGDIRCRWEERFEFRRPLPASKLIEGIGRVVRDLDEKKRSRLLAVGVSYPGHLDADGRLTAVNLGWRKFPLVEVLKEAFSLPLFLEHDKHSCLLAERVHGSAQNHGNAIFLIAERGVGLGILVGGRPLEGARGLPGEIGHCQVFPGAEDLCNCGQRGCLEAIASGPNIVRQYLEAAGRPPAAAGLRVTDVFEKARQQDTAALAVLERVGRALGLALSHAINILNPDLVILGGDLISGEDLLLPSIREEIRRRTLPDSAEGITIVVSGLGLDIRLKGAASLAFRSTLEDPSLLHRLC